jgi:hypothetical protein
MDVGGLGAFDWRAVHGHDTRAEWMASSCLSKIWKCMRDLAARLFGIEFFLITI